MTYLILTIIVLIANVTVLCGMIIKTEKLELEINALKALLFAMDDLVRHEHKENVKFQLQIEDFMGK